MKEVTKKKKIVSLPMPDLLLLPLFEQFGNKPKPVVRPGDTVRKYQLVAKAVEGYSAPIHSPVSGIIEKIEVTPQVDGSMANTIFIRNDHQETEINEPLGSTTGLSPEEILKIIEDAGIVGMGGAQFPTAMKYNRKGKDIKTFIINGVECEPFLTGDYSLMREHARQILEGILIINKVLEAEEVVIAFEEDHKELEGVFKGFTDNDSSFSNIQTKIVPDEYPQGGELQLIRSVTGIVVAKDTLPIEKGLIVSNVGTVNAVYDAVVNGKPLVERVITVSGEGAEQPGNYRIKIGTPITHIIAHCGIDTEKNDLVAGGPMMSPYILNLTVPMHKGSLGVVAIPKSEVYRLNCIWCGYCVDVCPMNLMPMKYDLFYNQERYHKLKDYDINDCIECGACEYICPSNVPLIKSIKQGKAKLKELKDVSGKKTS